MNEKTRILEEMSIGKLLIKMSLPATIGMLIMTLYNVVDAIFIGHIIGSLGLAAVSVVFPIMMVIIAISLGFGIGASSLISLNLGKKKFLKANSIFNNFLLLVILLGVVLSLCSYLFINKLLILVGSSEKIFSLSKIYFSIIIIGIPFQMISASLNNIIRAEGSAKVAMSTMIIGAVLNIILDYTFLVILHLGISGIAYATIIAQFFQFLFTVFYFFSKFSVLKINLKLMKLKLNLIKQISKLGLPSFIRQSSLSLVGIIMNNLLTHYGSVLDIAAYGILFRVSMIIIMPAAGILQGTQPIIGYNYGAKKFKRVKDVLKLSIKSSTLIMFSVAVCVMFFPEIFVRIFTNDEKLIGITSHIIRIVFIFISFIGFQFVVSGFFQSIGKAKPAIFLSLLRRVFVLIPLILILPIFFGINGIWYSYPISDAMTLTVSGILFYKEYKKL